MNSTSAESVDIFVEIPKGSRNKYEFDHAAGALRLDRHLFTATVYPTDYGFITDTLGEDGDPLDAMVLLEEPTFPGCRIMARPIALIWMRDEKGPDAKVLCVPANDPRWLHLSDVTDVPRHTLEEIRHFLEIYKDLEPEKEAVVGGWEGRSVAWRVIEDARARLGPRG